MRAGLYDRPISLQEYAAGSWSTTRSDWAKPVQHGAKVNRAIARASDGVRGLFGADEIPNERTLFSIRFDGTITPAWRLLDENGDAWAILGTYEGEGRKRETIIACVPFADYTQAHADLLTFLIANGIAVTFSKITHTHNPVTDELTPSTSSVAGYAMKVDGDPVVYERLSLTEKDAPTLLFAANTLGQIPEIGAACTFMGPRTAKEVLPDAPAGVTISSQVVVV